MVVTEGWARSQITKLKSEYSQDEPHLSVLFRPRSSHRSSPDFHCSDCLNGKGAVGQDVPRCSSSVHTKMTEQFDKNWDDVVRSALRQIGERIGCYDYAVAHSPRESGPRSAFARATSGCCGWSFNSRIASRSDARAPS